MCLIPESAHGTNFASAQMASMKIKVVKINKDGGIDMNQFEKAISKWKDQIAAIMITYPSTNGLFDKEIRCVGFLQWYSLCYFFQMQLQRYNFA